MRICVLMSVAFIGCVTVGCSGQPQPAEPEAWRPPSASAEIDVTQPLFVYHRSPAALGDANRVLQNALRADGYDTMRYLAVPNGFALVTQIEQIDASGDAMPGHLRWPIAATKMGFFHFSVAGYLRALFTENAGHYRVLMFIVTDYPFTQAERHISFDETTAWVNKGTSVLPREISNKPWTRDTACTALVYEFVRRDGRDPTLVIPGAIAARKHLQRILRTNLSLFWQVSGG